MALLIRKVFYFLVLMLLLESSSARAAERFATIDESGGLSWGDAIIGIRWNHYDVFLRRQVSVISDEGIDFRYFFGQLDGRIGLLPKDYEGFISSLEVKAALIAGGELFPNTPIMTLAIGATFRPLGQDNLTFQTTLKTTPIAMDHNATNLLVAISKNHFENRLHWIAGISLGYQAGGKTPAFLWSCYGAISFTLFHGLWINLEYGGQFRDGAITPAIGYTIADRVQIYLAAPMNYSIELRSFDIPSPAAGIVLKL